MQGERPRGMRLGDRAPPGPATSPGNLPKALDPVASEDRQSPAVPDNPSDPKLLQDLGF